MSLVVCLNVGTKVPACICRNEELKIGLISDFLNSAIAVVIFQGKFLHENLTK